MTLTRRQLLSSIAAAPAIAFAQRQQQNQAVPAPDQFDSKKFEFSLIPKSAAATGDLYNAMKFRSSAPDKLAALFVRARNAHSAVHANMNYSGYHSTIDKVIKSDSFKISPPNPAFVNGMAKNFQKMGMSITAADLTRNVFHAYQQPTGKHAGMPGIVALARRMGHARIMGMATKMMYNPANVRTLALFAKGAKHNARYIQAFQCDSGYSNPSGVDGGCQPCNYPGGDCYSPPPCDPTDIFSSCFVDPYSGCTSAGNCYPPTPPDPYQLDPQYNPVMVDNATRANSIYYQASPTLYPPSDLIAVSGSVLNGSSTYDSLDAFLLDPVALSDPTLLNTALSAASAFGRLQVGDGYSDPLYTAQLRASGSKGCIAAYVITGVVAAISIAALGACVGGTAGAGTVACMQASSLFALTIAAYAFTVMGCVS